MKSLRNDALLIILLLITGTPLWAQTVTPMVSAGNHHSLVLTEKGEVYGFGRHDLGALGLGNTNRIDIPVIVSHANLAGKTITDIEISYDLNHILILTSDGQVFSMGDNDQGQCGHPTAQSYISEPTRITQSGLDTLIVRDIAVGTRNSLLATNRGIYVFGNNANSFLGAGTSTNPLSTPVRLSQANIDLLPFKFIETSENGATYAIADNDSIFVWGINTNGQLGLGDYNSRTTPELLSKSRFGGNKVTKFSIQSGGVLALTENGKAYYCGKRVISVNFDGNGISSVDYNIPVPVSHGTVSSKTIIDIAISSNHGVMVASDGTVFSFANNDYGQLGLGDFNYRSDISVLNTSYFQGKTITKVFVAENRSYFLASDGTVFGAGRARIIGNSFSNNSLVPSRINTALIPGETIAKVCVKNDGAMSYMVTTSGKLISWDADYYFEGRLTRAPLLLRERPIYSRPAKLPLTNLAGKTVSKVRAGDHKSFFITTDGNVYGTGQASYEGLGTTDSLDVFDPVLLDQTHIAGKKIIEVATSGNGRFFEVDNSFIRSHTLLLADDGTIYGFGSNNNGQLGLGDLTNRRIPTPITTNLSGKTIVHIAVGAENSMAIASDGAVYLWGRGGNGEMGFGNTNDLNVPTLATHLSSLGKTFVKGAIGHRRLSGASNGNPHFIVLADDGTLFGFGENSDGQLGINNRIDTYTPTQVTATSISGKKIVDMIASVDANTLLRAETGEVYGMGRAYTMGFAEPSFRDYEVPTLINSAEITGRRIVSMSLFNQHSMLLLEDGRIFTASVPGLLATREGVLGNTTVPSEIRLHLPVLDFTTYASPVPTGNLALHLDAERLGFIPSNDSVSTWSNLAVSGQNGAQSTTASRPLVVDSVMNNRPALRFNGSNQFFTLPTAADLGIQNNDYEVFMVARSADSGIQFLLGGETIAQHELHLNGSAGVRFIPASDPSRYVDVGSTGTFTNGQTQLFTVQASSTYGEVAVNRNPSTRVNASMHSANAGVVYLGRRTDNSFYFAGDIAEVIIYNRVLSGPERGQIQDYLMGKYGITNSISSSVTLTGSEGWRLLASPVADSSYATLLSPLWTQGIPGAKSAVGNPNVYTWDATATGNASTNWLPLPQLNAPMQPGTGALVYVFSDDNYTDPGDAGFPKTLTAEGIEPLGTQNLSSLLNGNMDGWALVGNPFRHDIRWNALTKTNVYNAVYVYDNATAGWRSWNGTTGSLSNGTIGGFNGFLVQTMGSTPQLQIPDSAKTYLNQAFLGKQRTPKVLALHVQNEYGFGNTAWMHFSGEGEEGLDVSDAVQLAPMQEDYVQVSTALNDTLSLDISHLPLGKSHYELPLRIASSRAGRHTLSMHEHSLPEGWVVELQDTYTQRWIELSTAHTFEIEAQEVGKIAPIGIDQVPTPFTVAAPGMERFILHIRVGETVSVEESLLPRTYELAQNYPNPFNPTTTIQYQLPEGVQVRLEVYNLLGQRVARLVNERKSAGVHQVVFDAGHLSSGMYLYRITAGEYTAVKRLVVIK